MMDIPDSNWFDEAQEPNDTGIDCPVCFSLDAEEYQEDMPPCILCNNENPFSFNTLEFHVLVKKIEVVKKLNDDLLYPIVRDLSKAVYDCPECSSMEDEDYCCTSCWNAKITLVDRLLFDLQDETNNKLIIKRIVNIYSDI